MKKILFLTGVTMLTLGFGRTLAQDTSDLDLSTRSAGTPPSHVSVSSVAQWMENPIDQKLLVAVTNFYAGTNDCMDIMIGAQHLQFYGAGQDENGNYIPTNYPPVIVNTVLRREYPLIVMCPNSGPQGSPLFQAATLDWNSLLNDLTNSPTDPVSSNLWANFTPQCHYNITNSSATSGDQQTNITEEMNRIITTTSLYDTNLFANVTLSDESANLLAQNPTGQQLVELNRYLLQDALRLSVNSHWDDSGTAQINLSVQAPPLLRIKKNQPTPVYTVLLNDSASSGGVFNLYNSGMGYVSTNSSTVEIIKDKFAHFGYGDGCDDATKAPGQGGWLQMGPGCTEDTNRISLKWSVSLGRSFDGLAAGQLAIAEPALTRDTYTPFALYYNGQMTNFYATETLDDTNSLTNFLNTVVQQVTNTNTNSLSSLFNLQIMPPANMSSDQAATIQELIAQFLGQPYDSSSGNNHTNLFVPAQQLNVWSLTNFATNSSLVVTTNIQIFTNCVTPVVLVLNDIPHLLTNSSGQPYITFDSVIRQVNAYQTFVDVLTPDTNNLVLNFYFPNQVGTNRDQTGLYTNITGSPFVTYTLQNPQPATANNLYIIETRNGLSTTQSLVKASSAGGVTYALTLGTGQEQRVETRTVTFSGAPIATDRIESDSIAYASSPNSPAYSCTETYHDYPWGWELKQTSVPNGSSPLVTGYDYYDYSQNQDEDTYYGNGQVKQIIYPDGYWEKRIYEKTDEPIYNDPYIDDTAILNLNGCVDIDVPGALRMILTPELNDASGGASGPDYATVYNSTVNYYVYNGLPFTGSGIVNCTVQYCAQIDPVSGECFNLDGTMNEMLDDGYNEGEISVSRSGKEENLNWNFIEGNSSVNYTANSPLGIAGHSYYSVLRGGQTSLFTYDQGVFDPAANAFALDLNNHLLTSGQQTNYPDFYATKYSKFIGEAQFTGNQPTMDEFPYINGHMIAAPQLGIVSDGLNIFRYPFAMGFSSGRSSKIVNIYHGGNLAQTERHIYTGSINNAPINADYHYYNYSGDSDNWIQVEKLRYYSDAFGHTTNILRIDPVTQSVRPVYCAVYVANTGRSPVLQSETDEYGNSSSYVYDSLDRVTEKSILGHGQQPSQQVLYSYDANGSVTSCQTNFVGSSLSAGCSYQYDTSGRMTLCSLSSGLTYSTVYGDGGRNITNTMPGGLTQITHNNYSRKIKESIGSAAINQFYDYFIDPDGSMTDVDLWSFLFDKRSLIARIHSGTSGSSRWKLQGTDAWGEEVYQGAPASQNSTNIVYMENSYSTFGWLMESFDSTKGSWNKMSYDVNGNNCISDVSASYYEGFGYDGDPAFYLPFLSSEKTGNSRITETSRGLCQIGVAWYQSATNYAYLEDGNDNKCVQSIHLEQLNGFSGNEISNSIDYDADGNVTTNTTVIDRNNNVLTQITSTPNTSSQNAVTIYQNGRILSYSTLSVANPTTCSYDAFGRTNLIQDPQGNYMSMTYDPATGWLTSLTGAAGHTTFYSYYPVNQTNAGKLYCQTDANNKKTYYAYTPQGQLCQTWGDVPYPAEYRYNEYGDLTNLITFRGGSSWTGSTWAGDSGGDNTYWQYDEASGSLLSKTDAQGRSVNYTYYPETGLLFTRSWGRTFTDASNNIFSVTVTNLYDTTYFDETLGRYCDDGSGYGDMTAQCYNDGTPNVYFNDYSRVGQPREIVDGSGTNELIYDFSSRLVSTTCTNGLLSGITVSNHFNPYCGRDVLKVINTTGTPWTLEDDYGYDHNSGRLASVSSGTALATYGYVPNSDLLQSTTFANSGSTVMTTTRTWNHGFQLASIANTVAGASIPVTSHAYTYDAVNRRAEAKLEDGSAWLYGYNDRNELASANRQWLDTRPVAGQQFGYNYDNIGNRTWAQFGGDTNGNNLQTINYTANSLNQYTNIVTPGLVDVLGAALETNAVIVNAGLADRHGEYFHRQISIANTNQPVWQTVTNIAGTFTNKGGLTFPANSQTLVYDADGNLVSDGVWLYQWDGENRLISMWMTNVIAGIAASNTLKLDFAYDYLGRRVSKTVSKWNVSTSSYEASTTNYFVYDGWNLISIINPQSTNLVSFVWGNDLSGTITKGGGVGGLLIANISGTNCFAGYDGNGNISVFINSADKSLAARYEYSPYGQLIRKTGLLAAQIPIRFSTKFWDEETGLINYNARYYSPCLGKWMGRDPTADQIFLNLYLFSHNNPLNRFDKDGKDDLTLGDVMAACCASVAMDADMCMSLIITAGEGSSFGEFVGALNASVSCMASSVGAAASTAVYGSLAATGTTEVASTVLAGICGYFGNSVKGVTGIPGTESTVSAWSNIAGQVANKMNSPMGLQIINDAYNATIYLLSSDDGDDNSVWNINDDSDSN